MLSAVSLEERQSFEDFLEQDLNKELLRFTTAGSVDDGKSTLIGRLLHDSKAVYEDQLASVKKSRINRSSGPIDFSLLTDGLRAEREQGITIDVAYRYFSTARRKFIIADTPGHEQYTRNMATGASTADLAVILIDGSNGLLPQTRRHAYISSLLGIPHVLAAVNKMDLVGYREDVFLRLQADFLELARHLGIPFVQCIPISALEGDNVVARGADTNWYSGPTLLEHLESVSIHPATEMKALRFPVQSVIRPDANFRGFAGRIASGVVSSGDAVLALPSRQQTRVQSIVTYDGDIEQAIPSQSVVLKLEDEIDLSRGDMLVSPSAPPQISNRFAAMVVWLHEQPLQTNRTYLAKHAGRLVKAKATRIRFRVDVNSLSEHSADQLEMNGIAFVEFETSNSLFFDPYDRNRTTGSFILIDPISNATVGAAMIREALAQNEADVSTENVKNPKSKELAVASTERYRRHGHRSSIFSITGDLGVAERLERALFERNFEVLLVKLSEIPADALSTVLTNLLAAGLVVVFWTGKDSSFDPGSLKKIAGDTVFHLSGSESNQNEETVLEQALTFAETLRFTENAGNQREAD
jgi:bifunctional enzyme CysN/CysC/sulfate adenylyltransferase subunit 1